MPRPSGGYKLANGQRVPGVTTILDQWGAKARGLYYWNWEQGRKPLEAALGASIRALDNWLNTYAPEFCDERRVAEARQEILKGGGTLAYIAQLQQINRAALATEYGKKLEEEATLGTLVHSWIEAEMRGTPPPTIPAEHKERAENAMLGFFEWRDAFQLEVTGSEVPLVSETYHYGGTIDYPVRLKGRRAILDLKSSKSVYHDHRVQLAAYAQLWRECYPDDPPQGYHLLRVGKEDGSFSHHYWPSLQTEWEIFLHLRALYDLAKELK